jgi:hypothetical protein
MAALLWGSGSQGKGSFGALSALLWDVAVAATRYCEMQCLDREEVSVPEKSTKFDSASASEAVRRRWEKHRAREASTAASRDGEFFLGDVRRVGIMAVAEFERRLTSGRPLSDTAVSRAVGQLVQLLEAEENRRREQAAQLDAAGAVAADDGFLSTLKANRDRPGIREIVGEYADGIEELLGRVRAFQAELAA